MAGGAKNDVAVRGDNDIRRRRGSDGRVGAIVLGGGHVGLALTRSLGRHGIPVWCVLEADRIPALPALSRYCSHRVSVPAVNAASISDRLSDLATSAGLDRWVVYPTSDESAKALALGYDALASHFTLTISPWERFRLAYDKRCTYRLADEIGVDIPRTFFPRDSADLASLGCEFPVVLKPAIKETENEFTTGKAWLVHSLEELTRRYAEACALVPPETILVQEYVPAGAADQFSFGGVCRNGRLYAWVTAKRLRQYPDDFGVATYVATVPEPSLVGNVRKVLEAMRLTGFVEMDFVRDAPTGRLCLLDVNPRPWSWHGLGREAGVDFPYLLWQLLEGAEFDCRIGESGARWLHLVPDLQWAWRQARAGRLDAARYARTLLGRKAGAVSAVDDPLPGLMEPLLLLARRRSSGGSTH
jgi:D-aspartate ligase